MKKYLCALLIAALCVGPLAGCKKTSSTPQSPENGSSAAVGPDADVTAIPEEGSHGEEDQSANLPEQMPTVAPAQPLEGVEDVSPRDEPSAEAGTDEYFSVDDLIARTEEFQTYDESADPGPSAGTTQIDPNTMQFSALTDTSLHFTFNYPTNWENLPGVYTICFREPVEAGDYPARVSVTGKLLVHSPEGTELTDELTAFVRTISKQYNPEFFQLGTLNAQDTFMGRQAYSNTYRAYSGETEVKGFIIGCSVGRRLYVFHFNASYKDYEAMEKIMRYMVQSVQLVEQDD